MNNYLPISIQIQILFENVRHPEQRPYTLQEVSEGTGISVGTLSQLRSGKMQNPQLSTLRELCRYFQVPLRFFETETEAEAYAILAQDIEQDKPVLNEIALRAIHLSDEGQKDVLKVIQWVQAAEEKRKRGEDLPRLPNADEA